MPNPVLTRKLSKSQLDPATIDYRNRINAAGSSISNASLKAIDTFVKGCKQDNIWNSLLDVGVFAGDNLNAAVVKLKTPSEVQKSLTRFGFSTSDYSESAGLKGNGISKYLDTGLNPSTYTSINDIHISFYNRFGSNTQGIDIASVTANNIRTLMQISWSGTTSFDCYSDTSGTGRVSFADSAGIGFYIGTRTGGSVGGIYKNGSLVAAHTSSSGNVPNTNFFVFRGLSFYSLRQCSFYSIGSGLSASNVALLNSQVQALQQALNRAV